MAFGGLIRENPARGTQVDKQQHMVCQLGFLDIWDTKSGLKYRRYKNTQALLRALEYTNILEMSLLVCEL